MYEKILVPLDGSRVAEAVLPHVGWLAGGLKAGVTLLTVVDPLDIKGEERPMRRYGLASVKMVEETLGAKLKLYLQEVAKSLAVRGVEEAEAVVVAGNISEEILGLAETHGCDLIAMSTHGRSGIRRGLLGSVTDAVVRYSDIPVLVIGPRCMSDGPESYAEIKRVVVPLDGSPLAEAILPYVEELASRLSLEVDLMQVVKVPALAYAGDHTYHTDTTSIEEELESEAAWYLENVAHRLEARGIRAKLAVMKGVPATKIVDYAHEAEGSMVAISTHGRSGLGRLVIGSVADSVIRSLDAPVLVVRPSES